MAAPPRYGQGLAAPGKALTVPGSGPGTGTSVYAPPNTSGHSNDPVSDAGGGQTHGHAAMTPQQVRSMQQFLVNHGFQVAQDGVFGAQTKAAALAFRTNHKSGAQWSAKNGVGTHPTVRDVPPVSENADGPGPSGNVGAATGASGGVDAGGAFNTLLQQLLGQGGNVGRTLDPKSFGNAAAAPSDALAASYARQAAQNPRQEAQDQSDISSWYGLDPKDPNYKLSVLGRLATARGRDAQAATDAQSNVGDIAKQLASSIGGSANDGSGMVAAAGADAAGTMGALGEASKQYADDMSPLLAAEARGSQVREKNSSQQALMDLLDKQAQAKGQATADRASAVGGVDQSNNALAQQRFANKGNLLSTLAQMAAVDPNANVLKDALTAAKINHENAATNKIVSGKTSTGKVYKIDVSKATQGVINQLGYQVSPSGQAVVPTNDHQRLATTIGSFLRSQGFKPGDGQFKHIADTIFGSFVDQHGRPLVAPPNWSI